MVMMDLSKAFNPLSHFILLDELHQYDVSGPSFSWIKSYLSVGTQSIKISGVLCTEAPIRCNVRQGSILGSQQFLIYRTNYVF